MSAVNQARVAFRNVRVVLGNRTVLASFTLEVGAGETVVLLGRSGAGKTTALRLVNALMYPDAGAVEVEGRTTVAWDPVRLRRSVGYVIQEIGLFPHFTVRRNVGIVPELERWEAVRIRRRVDQLLSLVGLPPEAFADRHPSQLSGGQRQRVGVARALAVDPPLLLCDEPFGAVDPMTRADLQREFRDLVRRLKKTVLFVTHDVREALRLADRVAVLEEGQLQFVGTPEAFRRADEPVVRQLLETGA